MSDQDKQVRVLIEVARGRSVVGEDGKVYRPGESLEVDRADADALIGDGFALDSEETGAVAAVIQPIQGRQTIKMVSRQESVTQQPAATSRGARSRRSADLGDQ